MGKREAIEKFFAKVVAFNATFRHNNGMKIEKELKMNFTKISRPLIASLEFREFSTTDYYGFSGVQSPIPLIAENDDEGICVIIDGEKAELYCYDGCANFELVDICENIRELPYKTERELEIEAEIANLEKSLANLKAQLV